MSNRSRDAQDTSPSEGAAGRRPFALSVCCMTTGRRPGLLGGLLALLRPIADEIVVAVEAERAQDVRSALAGIADRVIAYPPTSPGDRPIAWLFRSCRGSWIFNIDDDEVPSPSLVAALTQLPLRRDITHAWVARRWLHPSQETYIASAPWGTEFQLRAVAADDRFVQFSDVFHRPVVVHGPGAFLDAPLWHLDTVLNPAALRRRKAAAYERQRPGLRIGGISHNLGLYVPELQPGLEVAQVPAEDREALAAALAYEPPAGASLPPLEEVAGAGVDEHWVGAPFAEPLYRGRLEVRSIPGPLSAGGQSTVDVLVTNGSDAPWLWGKDARPEIRLGYRWRRDGREVPEQSALRTSLPADLLPGASQIVPVHVVAPAKPGRYELELDILHEGARWFGVGASIGVEVRSQQQIALVATPARAPEVLSELDVAPHVEPVVILRDATDRSTYGDLGSVSGPRSHLLGGGERSGRLATTARLAARTFVLIGRAAAGRWPEDACAGVLSLATSADRLVVDGPVWDADAAFGREWAWVAVTALLWRANRAQVLIPDHALPSGEGWREGAVRFVLRRLRTAR